jgi:hypothetical protein
VCPSQEREGLVSERALFTLGPRLTGSDQGFELFFRIVE